MAYKTIDALMRHLRNSGIAIKGGKQKRQLINTGYFHGYKSLLNSMLKRGYLNDTIKMD